MAEVTQLLEAIRAGEPNAADRLMAVVYDELNRLAAAAMAAEAPGRTLSPTALVHEAYLRLASPAGTMAFENRRHFFAAAATAMRRILVDAARRRRRDKRGGALNRVELPDAPAAAEDQRLLALDEALPRLAASDAAAAQIVELHHFAGLSYEQTAEAMGVSVYEVRQKWTFARAWLRDAIGEST